MYPFSRKLHHLLSLLLLPYLVLQRRFIARGPDTVEQVLIKWSGMSTELATWEDFHAVKRSFPRAPAWGQAGSYEGGNVTASTTAAAPTTDEVTEVDRPRARRPNRRVIGPSGPSLKIVACVCNLPVSRIRDEG
jgi:hypothetical protein